MQNKYGLGNLKLTEQEDDLVAFLKALTDGFKVSQPAKLQIVAPAAGQP
jgi:hypothetical protein